MASALIKFVDLCSGKEHLTVSATGGGFSKNITITATRIAQGLSQDDFESTMLTLLIFKKAADGLNNNQLLAALSAGVTVTV